jgi:hypothetical protein
LQIKELLSKQNEWKHDIDEKHVFFSDWTKELEAKRAVIWQAVKDVHDVIVALPGCHDGAENIGATGN